MTTVLMLADKRETDVERLQKGKHLLILIVKEDWFGIKHGKELYQMLDDYKEINPNYTKDNMLVVAEQVIVEAGATLVSYNTMLVPY